MTNPETRKREMEEGRRSSLTPYYGCLGTLALVAATAAYACVNLKDDEGGKEKKGVIELRIGSDADEQQLREALQRAREREQRIEEEKLLAAKQIRAMLLQAMRKERTDNPPQDEDTAPQGGNETSAEELQRR